MKITQNIFFGILTVCALWSCSADKAFVPAYLQIDKINFTTDSGQGAATENINHAFVYIDDKYIGGYELPAKFPVLSDESSTVLIEAGVRINGLSDTPDFNPFYERIEQQIPFTPEQTITISPTTTYKSNVRFGFIENFNSQDQLFSIDLDNNTDTKIEITNQGSLNGNSGKITLSEGENIIVATDYFKNDLSDLPKNGTPVWLEIDYKTDVPIFVGVIGIDSNGDPEEFPEFGINPKDVWNKIYFDMTSVINRIDFIGFQVFLAAAHSGEGDKEIFLDNIKVVHFEN